MADQGIFLENDMKYVAFAFCALTAIFGVLGLVSPRLLEDLVTLALNPVGLYVGAGLRLLFGSALMVVASRSRAPTTLFFLGLILVFAGITMPLMGVERIAEMINWWLSLGSGFLRVWGVTAVLFGGLIAYAVTPKARDTR